MNERAETVVVDPGSEAPEAETVSGNSPKNNMGGLYVEESMLALTARAGPSRSRVYVETV